MPDSIIDFLEPLQLDLISNDISYKEGQIGSKIDVFEDELPSLDDIDVVLLGCAEQRGAALLEKSDAANTIRREFYSLYHWHNDIRIADFGNIKTGKSLYDTYAAMQVVLDEVQQAGRTVIILGGTHDLTLAQYHVFAERKKAIQAVGIDALIDINLDSPFRADNFLMELLTAEPNFLQHYNHIGFQSYFVHPRMLETMDKLRFDCFRVGAVKEHLDEMEPVIRNCHLLTFDVAAMAHAYAPGGGISPNGLNGEEACRLFQFAGMGPRLKSIGVYNYRPENDQDSLTAKQISQMLWYYLDGKNQGNREALMEERDSFNEYHLAFAEVETTFLQSKKTGRWWMQLPDKQFIACSLKDYRAASNNEIPERWLRAQERQ